jgi:hypothetical protein
MALGKKMLLLAAFCGMAWGQTTGTTTNLTTIQDTLFKADGTLFNGSLTIQWSTFDANNVGTVVQQSKTVSVVNGNLQVQLVPNATALPPANVYNVQYQSDGRQQFAEIWTVPVSTTPLRVGEVRVSTQTTTGSGTVTAGAASNQTAIPESSVIGLQADLGQRPLKGVGYGINAVAMVDSNGMLQTVVGDIGDCVFVDGTTGPCTQPIYSDAETPGGIVDGMNNTLTLQYTPLGLSLMLFRNGLYQTPNFDYTLNGSSIVFAAGAIPQPGDTLTASYRVDTSAGGYIGLIAQGGGGVRTAQAQVICSASGQTSNATSWTSLGGCDIPAAGLMPGDRIEVRFTFAHTGATSGFNFQINWGSTTLLARSGSAQDVAVAGRAESAITSSGAQISVESWGTVLPFLPGILNSPSQPGLKVDLRAALAQTGSDTVTLTNYTVLRYPGN